MHHKRQQNASSTEVLSTQDLIDPQHWSDICDLFTKEACSLMGLSKESPLSITVDAGCKALPALNSIRQVDSFVIRKLLEYGIFGEGYHISTNQSEKTLFSRF